MKSMKNLEENDIKALTDRFLTYVKIWTTSDSSTADKNIQPSTDRQFDLARLLEKELKDLGLKEVQVTDHCYVYGFLPASKGAENAASFCLLAHMDTVEEVSGEHVNPQIHSEYDGSKIVLKNDVVLDPDSDADLRQAGLNRETIITTDGTTLLGADDKAGVSAIMQAIEYLQNHQEVKHGPIEVIFSPDEETGHGMDNVPLNLLKSKRAYTVDGGHIGELENECFNAYKSDVTFTGRSKHTGSARPDMVNALTCAASFVSSLPRHEAPETTDGYQGFYAPMTFTGSIDQAKVSLILRDFTVDGMKKRLALVEQLANAAAASFGAKVSVVNTEQYKNMAEGLKKSPAVTENLVKAYEAAGIKVTFPPIRGGTDGSRLTEMGIPTPNIFTGGHNYHSRYEWCSVDQMAAACEVLINLAQITANA